MINIFRSHLLAVVNNISVWWHVAGAAIVVLILIFVPDHHQSVNFVYTERINNSGFSSGFYWFLVLPLGFLLTQYTITGFDASAHLSEETQGAADGAAKGIWRSIFYSAIGGYILLLSFVFAVQDVNGVNKGLGNVDVIFGQALPEGWHFLVLLISTAGQLFCATACLTSASRMTFAFSRDGAIPGSRWLAEGQPGHAHPGQRRDLRDHHRHRHHAAGSQEHRRRAGRVPRGRLRGRDRPLPGLRDPDLPALADG